MTGLVKKVDKDMDIMAPCTRLQSERTTVCVCPHPGLQEPMAGGRPTHAPQGAEMTFIRPNYIVIFELYSYNYVRQV